MSKNTKIIAIAGGVLILALVLFSALTKGGCGATFDVWGGLLGCSSKSEKAKPGSSRNFCAQNPDDPKCKGTKGGGEEGDVEDEGEEPKGDAPAREAADD